MVRRQFENAHAARTDTGTTLRAVGGWYWIGVSAGLGAGAGVLLAGFVGRKRAAVVALAIVAGAVGAGLGWGVDSLEAGGWGNRLAGIVGGILGGLAAAQIVGGALRRGGTRSGTAMLVGGAGIIVAALGFVPVLGYLEALALPALAARLRRSQPERYAGLRTLAKD
jgi:hypothetical protein